MDLRPRTPDQIAVTVLQQADGAHPADGVLREVLRGEIGLTPDVAAVVARRVFGYYRWRGWIEPGLSWFRQLQVTTELAARFASAPESFPDADMVRAVPAWTSESMEVSSAWLRSLQLEPRLWLRARPGTAPSLEQTLGECVRPWPERLPDALGYRGGEDLHRHPLFQEGRFELQDLSSQVVGALCAPNPGETWWDACAGEGGKTLHLADQMQNRGVVWATDRAGWRLDRLRLRAKRAGLFNIRWQPWLGDRGIPLGRGRFDGVLVDAPCSGLGTWQRNPHARWTCEPSDVRELAAVQLELLVQAAAGLKRGGRLVYAVCTLTRAETIAVVEALEGRCPELEPLPIPAEWRSGVEENSRAHQWLIRPEERGGNGMFLATWRRG